LVGSASPSGPGTEAQCSGTELHLDDGSDVGEATYAQMIQPGDEIHLGAGQGYRVVDLVPFDEEDESPFVGLLQAARA
jgi:hypothetical protein